MNRSHGTSVEFVTDWRGSALCLGAEDYWFPEESSAKGIKQAEHAKSICRQCPVRIQCLDDAMQIEANGSDSHRHGIRGGLNGRERVQLARKGRR